MENEVIGKVEAHCLAEWMSREELASELGLAVSTLRRWDTLRTGPVCIRVGRKVMYRRADVQSWLSEKAAKKSQGRRR